MNKKDSIFSGTSKDIDLSGKPPSRDKMFAQADLGNKISDIVQNLSGDPIFQEQKNRREYVIKEFERSKVPYPVASIDWPNHRDKDCVAPIEATFEGDPRSFGSRVSETHREYEYDTCGNTIKIYPPGNVNFATVRDTVDKELSDISSVIEHGLKKLKA